MDDSIINLYQDNIISKEEALNFAINSSEIIQRFNSIDV